MKGAHIAEEEPAFPAVFASYVGFSWLGSCMVSRETCFFHLLRHASPLRWPACFHLSQLSSGMLLKVLSVFWETQLLIWDAYPINLCLVQKILLKPLLKKNSHVSLCQLAFLAVVWVLDVVHELVVAQWTAAEQMALVWAPEEGSSGTFLFLCWWSWIPCLHRHC